MTQADIRRKKRENSFIRDGYEVYVEGFYIINGKKKKKIKKRKLSRQVIDRHDRILQDKLRSEKESGNEPGILKIEKEI